MAPKVKFLFDRHGYLIIKNALSDTKVTAMSSLADARLRDYQEVIAYLYGGQATMNVPSWSPDSGKFAFVSNSGPLPQVVP